MSSPLSRPPAQTSYALFCIAGINHAPTTEKYLAEHPELNRDQINNEGETPLNWSIKSACAKQERMPHATDHFKATKVWLKDKTVNPNKKDPLGMTPLHWAAWRGNITGVDLLLCCSKIDASLTNNRNETPSDTAFQEGHSAVVRLLFSHQNKQLKASVISHRKQLSQKTDTAALTVKLFMKSLLESPSTTRPPTPDPTEAEIRKQFSLDNQDRETPTLPLEYPS